MLQRVLTLLCLLPSSLSFGNSNGIPLKLGAESQSLQNAYGCVNVMSGDYFETNQDVELGGAAPLSFIRCYETSTLTSQNWKGVNQMLAFPLDLATQPSGFLAVTQREGAYLKWKTQVKNGVVKGEVDPLVYDWGCTNFAGGELSGRSHLKNQSMSYINNQTIEVCTGSGAKYYYRYSYFSPVLKNHNWILFKEVRPDGHRVHFDYAMQKGEPTLRRIWTTNASETLTFNSITITPDANGINHSVSASNGDSAHYALRLVEGFLEERIRPPGHKRLTRWLKMTHGYCLGEVTFSHKPKIIYAEQQAYEFGYRKPNPAFLFIHLNQGVDGRFRKIHYSTSTGQVTALQAPLGTDQTPITQATFSYAPTHTSVCDAYGHETIYRFVQPKRIAAVERWQTATKKQLYSAQCYYWGNSGSLQGNLLARGTTNGANQHLNCIVGTYDDRGNVIREELYGNLTGQGKTEFELGQDYRPKEVECYATVFQYSDDGFNLPLREEHPDGKVICYRYLPGTDRIVAKLTGDQERFFIREFHRYSDDPLLLESIYDDGCGSDPADLTGVTSRKIVHIAPRYQTPAIGSPSTVVEAYLDLAKGTEHQLKRTDYQYDARDLVIQEDIYDAHDQLQISLQYVYDVQKNLIAKNDALGRITQMRYDANKNKISEELVGGGYRTEYTYDFSNRLIKAEEIHVDGVHLTTCFRYDYLNRKVASIDPFGHETRYTYDSLGREIVITYPPHIRPQGTITTSTIRKEYNVLDQLIAVTDQNSRTTRTSYNIRGQPTLIAHPDGTKERFVYNLNGTLAKKWEINGLCHHYTYDVLGRLLRTESYDTSGVLQATLCHEYAGSNLIRVTNAIGIVTEYTYDGAGRKITETCDAPDAFSKTQITYDPLNRVATTTRWHSRDPQDAITQTQEYDLLDRPIGLQVEDANGTLLSKELYEYDIRGNRILTRVFHSPTESSDAQIDYDTRNLPIRLIDDLGHVTHISYDYQHRNSCGQNVLRKITTDPLGRTTTVTQDARGRIQESTTVDPLGNLLSHYHLWQDAVGNLNRRTDDIIANGKVLRQMITEWSYDSRNRPLRLIEAFKTSEERRTKRSYNSFGQLEAIQLADGITLSHAYDPMGRLSHYYASDNSFSYRYQYDPLGNVLSVEDTLTNTYTLRQYDSLQRITQETLGNGLTLDYQYDALNRPTRLTLPDSSAIAYTYDATNLSEIQRLSPEGAIRYAHRTLSHNLRGKPVEAQLIGTSGSLTYTYDRLGRPQSLTSPYHSDTVPEDGYDAGGNLLKRQGHDAFGTAQVLRFNETLASCKWFPWPWGEKKEKRRPQQAPWEWSYRYDALDQLVSENSIVSHQYQNDSLNNRLSKDDSQYELNHLNMLVKTADTLYLYDRRGNLIESQTSGHKTSYRYDALGRLLELETPISLQRYLYDSFNRRLSQTSYTKQQTEWVEAETQNTLYAGQNDIGAFDNSHQLIRLRLLGEGRGAEIGAAVAIELKAALYTPLHDLCGNVVALVDSQGHIAESYRYSAFGEEQIFSPGGILLNRSFIGNPWRYSSKTTDDTGFVYFGRRYFIPLTGRWLTPDPIGYEAGPNLYAYVHNNPLTHVDLYGLYAQQPANSGYSLRQSAYNGFRYAASLPGRCIEFVGRHLLPPIEIARQAIMSLGRFLSFRPARGCSECHEIPSHEYPVYGYREDPNTRLSCDNGILNNAREGKSFGQYISDAFGGLSLSGLYNRTHGFVGDIAKTLGLSYGGAITKAARELANTWTRLYHEMEGDVRKIIHIAHSQGAAVAWAARKLISDEVAQSIDYIGLGGAKMIPNKTFAKVRNIVNTRDWVSMAADAPGHLAANCGADITIEYIQGQGMVDHSWEGTYKNVLDDIGLQYQKNSNRK